MKKIITLTFSIMILGIFNNYLLAQENRRNNIEMSVQEQKPTFNNGINSDEEKTSNQVPSSVFVGQHNYTIPSLESRSHIGSGSCIGGLCIPFVTVPSYNEEINIVEPSSNNNCQITKEQRRQSKKMLEEIRNRLNTEDFHEFVTYEPKNCDFKKLSYRERVYQSILP
jgi:hypothetical protein